MDAQPLSAYETFFLHVDRAVSLLADVKGIVPVPDTDLHRARL